MRNRTKKMLSNTKETEICRICLEPIFNFICIDCIAKSTLLWLNSKNSDFTEKFKEHHNKIAKMFASEQNTMKCIRCNDTTETVICPYCYAKEIFFWLYEINANLAKDFLKIFDFDFMDTGYLPSIETRNLIPIIISEKRQSSDLNICDLCDQVNDDLREMNGLWICESCRD